MPTKYELNEIYLQQVAIGGFASTYYWSSTEYGNSSAWLQYFVAGSQNDDVKVTTFYVRAVRAF
jgi:hypothetical protein